MENNDLLRKIQLTQLEIMKEIDFLCRKNNISYFLCAGTMLGAVRHHGFIPWDDDLDIMVPREDFDHLLVIMQKELPSNYWLQSYSTDEHYWQPFAKVRKLGTVYKEKGMEKFDDERCGVWVDVFPLDYAKRKNTLSLKWRKFWVKIISYALRVKEFKLKNSSFSRRYIPIIVFLNLFSPVVLKKWQESIMYNKKRKGDYLINLASTYEIDKETYPKEWFESGMLVKFEDAYFQIPRDYDKYLSQLYGNYMELPPVEKRCGHNISDYTKIIL